MSKKVNCSCLLFIVCLDTQSIYKIYCVCTYLSMKSIVLFICLLSSTLAIRPHIISILQDDLGFYDSGIHNPAAKLWTRNITQLAETGVILNYHYSHWHCSPSRRSFITGRLPIHHGEQLSSNDSDDIDLRMTWISDKLTKQGT